MIVTLSVTLRLRQLATLQASIGQRCQEKMRLDCVYCQTCVQLCAVSWIGLAPPRTRKFQIASQLVTAYILMSQVIILAFFGIVGTLLYVSIAYEISWLLGAH